MLFVFIMIPTLMYIYFCMCFPAIDAEGSIGTLEMHGLGMSPG